jgi:hypothetical protein
MLRLLLLRRLFSNRYIAPSLRLLVPSSSLITCQYHRHLKLFFLSLSPYNSGAILPGVAGAPTYPVPLTLMLLDFSSVSEGADPSILSSS